MNAEHIASENARLHNEVGRLRFQVSVMEGVIATLSGRERAEGALAVRFKGDCYELRSSADVMAFMTVHAPARSSRSACEGNEPFDGK